MSDLDAACFGPRWESWEAAERRRAFDLYRELHGAEAGALLYVPTLHCELMKFRAGDHVDVSGRKGVLAHVDAELQVIEVIYGDA